MSTNTGTTTTAASATEHRSTQSKRRLSWRSHTLPSVHNDSSPDTSVDPHAALMQGHDHEGLTERTRHSDNVEEAGEKKSLKIKNMMTPYLAQHIPQQYNPLGSNREGQHAPPMNTKYCYRHRPNTLCRRQADEPSMEQLQEQLGMETQADQQSIANVWALFSAAPSRHRNLMLQGILAQCCFPQLSFISSTVRTLIKIDFLGALPTELGFKILCYLDTASLCSAAQVSQRWRQLADDDVVWHRMCEQHIDRKCTKCGWGLPLLDQRRLRNEKRRIQLRATGRGINQWSPELTPMPEPANSPATLVHRLSDASDSTAGTKRSHPEDASSPESSSKRSCTNSEVSRDQLETYFDQPKKRPWKDVYKDRFKVGTNWKYGRYDLKVLKGHENGVMCLQFDDRTLITGSYDATVKVWDIETGQEIRTLTGHTQGIRCLQFDDSKLITGSLDRTMKVWNWRTGQLLRTITGHQDGVIGLHLEGKLLASGSADNSILIHDFNNYSRTKLLEHTDWVNSVKIDAKSNTLFSASDDMTVKLWDLETKECIATYEGHAGQVQQVLPLPHDIEIDEDAFPKHGRGDSYTVPSQTCFARFKRHSRQDPSVPEFFPDEPDRPQPPSWMLTGSLDGTVRLWNVPTGRVVCTFLGHIEGVWSLACDSLRLVTGAEDKMIKIWDPRTGGYERTLSGHEGPVTCVGLSDERVISGSEDGTVRIYCFNEQ